MTLKDTLESALIGQATKADVIAACDEELESSTHEMTLTEYIESMRGKRVEHGYYSRKGQLIQNHQNAVIHALQTGKTVTARVIESLYYPLPKWTENI